MRLALIFAALLLASFDDDDDPPRVQWVVLHATWCPPCVDATNDYRPYFEKLKPRLTVTPVEEDADIWLIDIDLEKDAAQQILRRCGDQPKVKSIPQFILIVDGEPVERHWRYPGKKRMHEAYLEAVKGLKVKK